VLGFVTARPTGQLGCSPRDGDPSFTTFTRVTINPIARLRPDPVASGSVYLWMGAIGGFMTASVSLMGAWMQWIGASISLMSAILSLMGAWMWWMVMSIPLTTASVSLVMAFIDLAHTVMSVAIAVIRGMVARSSERNAFMKAKRPVMAPADAGNQRDGLRRSLKGALPGLITPPR
jgi:hypothetical protein